MDYTYQTFLDPGGPDQYREHEISDDRLKLVAYGPYCLKGLCHWDFSFLVKTETKSCLITLAFTLQLNSRKKLANFFFFFFFISRFVQLVFYYVYGCTIDLIQLAGFYIFYKSQILLCCPGLRRFSSLFQSSQVQVHSKAYRGNLVAAE